MLYELFLQNTVAHKDKILPLMIGSSSAFEVFARKGIKFDFIYIDGDHRTMSVYNDLQDASRVLNQDGLILGDDYSWETVQEGVRLFLEHNPSAIMWVSNSQYLIRF